MHDHHVKQAEGAGSLLGAGCARDGARDDRLDQGASHHDERHRYKDDVLDRKQPQSGVAQRQQRQGQNQRFAISDAIGKGS